MIKAYIKKDFLTRNCLSLYFVSEGFSKQKRSIISKIEWTELKDDGLDPITDPIRLEQEEAQRLIDELWDAGLRPSEGSGSAGAMAATQKHLEDMRTLVFKIAH